MQVQEIWQNDRTTWMVLDDNHTPIMPILEFLSYIDNCERSPNTVRSYAYHLRLFWEYLQISDRLWTEVKMDDVARFIEWLRLSPEKVISLSARSGNQAVPKAKRRETTVNAILTAVGRFYDFQEDMGTVENIPLYKYKRQPKVFKDFLHHLNGGKPTKVKELKLQEPKINPKTLTKEEVRTLIDACHRLRDKFLIALMYESGIRIGQALGMRHSDIKTYQNLITVIPRDDNLNGARAKRRDPLPIDVTKDLMDLYSAYTLEEFQDCESDYIFVNLWEGKIGEPMRYGTVAELFVRLNQKTGIKAHPHKFRHSHATDLIRSGWDAAYVQKRLGHAHYQTTVDAYVHLDDRDMKSAYQDYLSKREQHDRSQDSVD
jgi:integrase/recombinase XerD